MSLATGFYVWDSGAVGWLATLDLQYGDGTPPYAQTPLPAMSSIEPYDVILHLTLPATSANYELGNFMASLTLTTNKNRTVTNVRKPTIIIPPTQYLPFSAPKKVRVDVPFLKDYVSGTTNLVATIQLGRKDGWKSIGSGVGREVSVLSASLEGVLKYRGIRGLVSKYPISAAAAAAAAFFIVSFSTVALLLAPAIFWQYQDSAGEEVKTEAPTPSPAGEKPRRRSSLKRSSSRGADEGIKHEPEDVAMPSSSSPGTPLRRRRSRISDRGDEE
ncbi:unnamed protein product [Peniophora sp. CBMAI 1063]|nr:unnamed protein product [Peniophora sp. CBMAI 1063]